MLEVLRCWSTSWSAKIFFALLVLSLGAFLGMGKFFSGESGRDIVVSVGSTKIKTFMLRRHLQNYVSVLRSRLQKHVSFEDLKRAGVASKVLNDLIHQALLDEEAKRLGVVISDSMLKKSILKDPTFHDALGEFSHVRFVSFLKTHSLSEAAFLKEQRQLLKRRQLLRPLEGLVRAPDFLHRAIASAPAQRRLGSYVLFKNSDVVLKEPSKKSLISFFDTHKERFKRGECRSFDVLFIPKPAAENSGDASTTHIARVRAIERSLADGLTFERVAEKYKCHLVHFPLREAGISTSPPLGSAPSSLKRWLSVRSNVEALSTFAFEAGGVEEPIVKKIDDAFYVFVDVKDVRPSFVPDFSVVQPEVRRVFQQVALEKALYRHGEKILSEMSTRKHKLRFTSLPSLTLNEANKNVLPEIQTVLFQMEPKEVRLFQTVKGQVGLVRLERIDFAKGTLSPKKVGELRKNITDMMRHDLVRAYVQSLRMHHHTQIHQDALDLVLS